MEQAQIIEQNLDTLMSHSDTMENRDLERLIDIRIKQD